MAMFSQSSDPEGALNQLTSMQQRSETKRVAASQHDTGSSEPPVCGSLQDEEGADEPAELPGSTLPVVAGTEDQLLLVDLVSFDHCQEKVHLPCHEQQQLLLQFDTNICGQPLPNAARQQADQLQRLPQETLGLYVPPYPRISNFSLYKLEQRLAKARRLDMRRVVAELQEQFEDAQHPVEQQAPYRPEVQWLDGNGLMVYQPSPCKVDKERPWRRYDQDEATTSTAWLPAVLASVNLLDSRGVSYRLDVELGRLEFDMHPYMSLEHQLAAKLLCTFREYHRRAALGLAAFYSQKLAALEDGLLSAREQLFAAHEQGQPFQEVQCAAAAVASAEQEVAEVRQLKEEEESILIGAIDAMAGLWRQLVAVRQRQGGLRLTDIEFNVVQLPLEDATPLQADGLTRQQLDIALLVAEAEPVAGLPPYPDALPLSQADAGLSSFKLRRVECMAASHAMVQKELLNRLVLLQDRVSADPEDPEIKSLQQQLETLGPAPCRARMTHQQELELWSWAEAEVAAGRAGVYRPPHLQPCLKILPAASAPTARAAQSPRAVADITSATGTAAAATAAQTSGLPDAPDSPGWVAGSGARQFMPVSAAGPNIPVRLAYYTTMLANGRVVGTSEVMHLRDDFTLDFRDVFTVRLLKWPDSMQLQLWEKGTFRDTMLAEFYLVVPGLAGTPHVDPQPKPYSWTSPHPVPHQKLQRALAALEPLGVLPAAAGAGGSGLLVGQKRGAAEVVAGTASPHQRSRAAPAASHSADASTGFDATTGIRSGHGGEEAAELGAHSTVGSPRRHTAVYPSGRLFVRCGWVADTGLQPHGQTSDSNAIAQLAKQAMPLQDVSQVTGYTFEDGMVQVSILQPGQAGRPSVPQLQQYWQQQPGSPLAVKASPGRHEMQSSPCKPPLLAGVQSSSPHASPSNLRGKQRVGSSGGDSRSPGPATVGSNAGMQVFDNPLAHIGKDVEVGPTVAPPLPHIKTERVLHRAVAGSHQPHHTADNKWLAGQLVDPNDPRNAMVLELLRAREAAAHGSSMGHGGCTVPGLFRLDLWGELLLGVDRVANQRASFIKQRWQAGPYRSAMAAAPPDAMQGNHQLSLVAPLSVKDTLDLQDAHREALALVEAASLGLGLSGIGGYRAAAAGAVTAALSGRQERSLRWAQGTLAKAIGAREAGIRALALHIRAACNQMGRGHSYGRRFKTQDVVKDSPLPEFRLDLSSLAAMFAPNRPLRPQKRTVKRLQSQVPRDAQLVITLQRASNLPRRLAVGGGVRQSSPNRLSITGARISGRFIGMDRQPFPVGTSSYNGSSHDAAADGGFLGSMRAGTATLEEALTAAGQSGSGFGGLHGQDGAADGHAAEDGLLSCFVEVRFRGQVQRTAAVDSNLPTWHEQMLFPVIGLEQEASPSALKESEGLITINIFDEVITPTAAAKAQRSMVRTAQPGGIESLREGPVLPERERRFLGCLRLPLSSVYQAEVIDGAFKLDVPPVLLGYVQDSEQSPSLSVYITLRPRLAPAAEVAEERMSGEQGDIARHACKWVAGNSSLHQCHARVLRALAVDPEGVSTLITRYMAPTPLPPHLSAAAAGAELQAPDGFLLIQLMLDAARLVAHVPFLEDIALGKRRTNVWTTNAELISLAAGDHEEHAHLLAGYFMELGQEVYVVLGSSLTGAQAAFVLTTGRPIIRSTIFGASHVGAPASDPTYGAAQATPAAQPPTEGSAALTGADAAGSAAAESSRGTGAAGAGADSGLFGQHQQQLQQQLQQTPQQRLGRIGPAAAATNLPSAAVTTTAAARPLDVSQLRLWNPLTGRCSAVRDAACELRQVGTVYNSSNIWANIQLSGHPWDISWHLGDQNCWSPFFGPVMPHREMASIQVAPVYSDLEPRFYEELEARVEETVRDALYEARSVVVTQPNNKLSRVLKALLKDVPGHMRAINAASLAATCVMHDTATAIAGPAAVQAAKEKLQQRLQLVQTLQVSHNDRVAREMRGCLINGHILALPFSDSYADAISEAVINTGVHKTVDPRVKFAMAAYVESLGAAFVCCLWIYVAAIRETS